MVHSYCISAVRGVTYTCVRIPDVCFVPLTSTCGRGGQREVQCAKNNAALKRSNVTATLSDVSNGPRCSRRERDRENTYRVPSTNSTTYLRRNTSFERAKVTWKNGHRTRCTSEQNSSQCKCKYIHMSVLVFKHLSDSLTFSIAKTLLIENRICAIVGSDD